MRRVAIVGGAPTTAHEAPYDDPAWEIWGLPWQCRKRVDVYFEPHDYWATGGYYPKCTTRPEIVDWLNGLGATVHMAKAEPEVTLSKAIPWDAITKNTGKASGTDNPYIESTIGVMLAVACLEMQPGDKVGLWGVDLDVNGEYAFQRPNAEYYIGFLRGRGVNVFVPRKSALLSSAYPQQGRYGVVQ